MTLKWLLTCKCFVYHLKWMNFYIAPFLPAWTEVPSPTDRAGRAQSRELGQPDQVGRTGLTGHG